VNTKQTHSVIELRGHKLDRRVIFSVDWRYGIPTLCAVEGRCTKYGHTDSLSPSCSIVCMFEQGDKLDVGVMVTNTQALLTTTFKDHETVSILQLLQAILHFDSENTPSTIWHDTLVRYQRAGAWCKTHPNTDLKIPAHIRTQLLEHRNALL
jgi:hypothetical protein